MFIIKAVGGVTSPTLTVSKNLSAFVNSENFTGVSFNPLSGAIKIERSTPGTCILTTPGTFANGFTMPSGIEFVKFHVTGSGATGGNRVGGAASTITGYIYLLLLVQYLTLLLELIQQVLILMVIKV